MIAMVDYGAGNLTSVVKALQPRGAAAVPWLDEAFGDVERGLGYGVLNLLYATGYTIGPLIGGALLGVASANAAYVLTAVALAGCALVVLRRLRAPTAGPA